MKVLFSQHALDQVKRRKISKSQIIKAIESPDETETSYRGRELLRRKVGSKILEVVTMVEAKRILVITAYYLEGAYEN